MKHSTKIEKYDGTTEELAEDVGNTRYDFSENFYKLLSEKYLSDAKHDKELGHEQVHSRLIKIAELHKEIQKEFSELWKICEKHMK
jgi:hypothetical protein